MNLQHGVELELQFYNEMQAQHNNALLHHQQQQQQQSYVQQQPQQQWYQQQQQQLQYPYQPQSQPQQQPQYTPETAYSQPAIAQFDVASQQQHHQQPLPELSARDGAGSNSRRAKPRKRNRASRESSEEDSDDGKASRLPGACTHCKKLKMKCDFPDDENVCRRCKAGGHQCIVEGRKPRTAPNKREYLLAQIRQKDRTIAFLLKQVQNANAANGHVASSPPSTSSFNPSLSDPAQESDQSDAILKWLSRHRSPSAGVDDQHIELNITGPEADANSNEPLLSLPPEPAPLGMMASLAIRDTPSRPSSVGDPEDNSDGEIGIARSDYFHNPAMDPRRLAMDEQTRPEILVKGIVTFEEVDELFEIFFSRLNVVLTVLDETLHTPASTFARCPFLFTVICATAARYYAKKPELYPVAMHFAREAAGRALTHAYKSLELCQAYIIIATYGVPAKRWEEDRNWLYIGMAIRIATDLNLQIPLKTKPTNETQEREMLNRTRVWLICWNLDRSTSTQFGRVATLREGFIVRNSADWYRSNQFCSKYDIHLCAYTALLRIMARFVDEVFSDENTFTGLNKDLDWLEICNRYNAQLDAYNAEWDHRFNTESNPDDLSCVYRTYLLPFVTSYSRLVLHSFGFQHAMDRGIARGDIFFKRCLDAAVENNTTLLDKLAKTSYLRFAPDGHFVFSSFATAFLIKMLRPEYRHLLDQTQRDQIVSLVSRVVDVMGSRDISIDDKHTPKLYSRFLGSLLARQQAADKEARSRTRKTSSPNKSASQSPPSNVSIKSQPMDEFPPAPPPPLYISAEVPRGQSMLSAQRSTHHSDGLLHVERYSDAGTETTVDGRHSQEVEVPSDEMLASMQALSNPAWWNGVMMPGYSWPQQESPVYATAPQLQPFAIQQPQYQQQQQQQQFAPMQTLSGAYLVSR